MCMKNGNPHSAQKASSEGPRLDIFIQHDEVDGGSPDFMMGVLEQCSKREKERKKENIVHASASRPEVASQ